MPFISPIQIAQADAPVARTLEAVRGKLGMVPNLFATFAHAPVVLNAYLALSETLAGGRLTAAQRELVALAVGQANGCQYCLSAHTLLARGAGVDADAVALARAGRATQTLDDAVVRLARLLVEHRGRVSPGDLEALRSSGLDDGLMLEVVAAVALNVLTNYTNHVAGTAIDFPVVAV